MKTRVNWLSLACYALALAATIGVAQSIQPIYSFTNGPGNSHAGLVQGADGSFYGTTEHGGDSDWGTIFKVSTNGALTTVASFSFADGANPEAALALGPDGDFYGTTFGGGNNGNGVVFKVTPDGTLTSLVSFGRATSNGTVYTNATGARPYAGLTLGPDGSFYGTTSIGGSSGNGTVFKVSTNGVLTTLASFVNTNINGANPHAGVTLGPAGNFYGTTYRGGTNDAGTVYRITPDGTLTGLTSLTGRTGEYPEAALVLGPDGNFYGTTSSGGESPYPASGKGTVFRVTTNGAVIALVAFSGVLGTGAFPYGNLTVGPDDKFYGTTYMGGSGGMGTVFEMTTNGVLTTLSSFSATISSTNGTGANPYGGLTLGSDGNFYGTAYAGGEYGAGAVFQMTTNGGLATLTSLPYANHGAYPQGRLAAGPDSAMYGATYRGGTGKVGTVFKVTSGGRLTTLVNFAGANNGASPLAGPVPGPDGSFYGTTSYGGTTGDGTIFRLTTNGVLSTVFTFSNNTNGATPEAALLLASDGNLYGTTFQGGSSYAGTVFSVTTNGALTELASFTNTAASGGYPETGLTVGPDGNFYGTTSDGVLQAWQCGYGKVFRQTTDGAMTTLFSFSNLGQGPSGFTNATGADPSSLTLGLDGNFYGTARRGGVFAAGTAFKITTNGVLTTLAHFAFTNGAYPEGGLTLGPDGDFYGTTSSGGSFGRGTVFKLTPAGGLSTLVSFASTEMAYPVFGLRLGGLALAPDGNFYGMNYGGGGGGAGIIYRLNLPPTVLAGPADQAVLAGTDASFTVGVFGTGPFSYLWLFNGAPVTDGTNSALTISGATPAAAGNYQVVVSNSWGSVTSRVAGLTVALAPSPYRITKSADGSVTLYLADVPGSTNRLWAATNVSLPLAQWEVIATNIIADGFYQFTDTNTSGSSMKFYRLSRP